MGVAVEFAVGEVPARLGWGMGGGQAQVLLHTALHELHLQVPLHPLCSARLRMLFMSFSSLQDKSCPYPNPNPHPSPPHAHLRMDSEHMADAKLVSSISTSSSCSGVLAIS